MLTKKTLSFGHFPELCFPLLATIITLVDQFDMCYSYVISKWRRLRHKSPAAVGGEVARNQALKISRLFHEKIKTMVEIKL